MLSYRPATPADVPAIFAVRTSVTENLLTIEQMERIGITPASVAAGIRSGKYGTWVCQDTGRVIAFVIANRESASIFGLFVLPQYQRRGIGTTLLDTAVNWLWQQGADYAWLTTGQHTRAVAYYQRRGWLRREEPYQGEYRFELPRPHQDTD